MSLLLVSFDLDKDEGAWKTINLSLSTFRFQALILFMMDLINHYWHTNYLVFHFMACALYTFLFVLGGVYICLFLLLIGSTTRLERLDNGDHGTKW